jgi:hypothetical protein
MTSRTDKMSAYKTLYLTLSNVNPGTKVPQFLNSILCKFDQFTSTYSLIFWQVSFFFIFEGLWVNTYIRTYVLTSAENLLKTSQHMWLALLFLNLKYFLI